MANVKQINLITITNYLIGKIQQQIEEMFSIM